MLKAAKLFFDEEASITRCGPVIRILILDGVSGVFGTGTHG